MTASPDQLRLLGAFVRAHRERLPAPTAGIGRRRTTGLRREEAAQLCGISTTWYTWIEQGRDISISAAALARLSDMLRLTAAERAYVFDLAQRRDPAPPGAAPEAAGDVPAHLVAAVSAVAAPAYLLDRAWRARAWNGPALRLFADWLGGPEPCLLRYVFLDPSARRLIHDWEDRARRLLAEFRADTALAPDDIAMRTLVEGLRRGSADFARFWDEHAVLGREGGLRRFDHPQDGALRFVQVTLVPSGHPDLKFVMLLPKRDAGG